jgi:diaminohydroxyphosphoribosylaminopyrimidine deaminase/5-amino-6-(5-phosphoribosylamino)uracil reductase
MPQAMRSRGVTPAQDERWMQMAVDLARQAVGLASPNPSVGCVIVRDGSLAGRGSHRYDDKDHAEVVALKEAGSAARGATAYVTLEPCAHTGRTGSCALALLEAGIARVVIATGDPNPHVNGKGAAMLRDGGATVSFGPLSEPSRALNDGFARWIRTGLPLVEVKAAVSLDGRIAPPAAARQAGAVTYLTGARSLMAVHGMRHTADAVMAGIGTVLADNPLLTDRSGGQRRRRLLRVILDSQLRLPLASRIVRSAEDDLLVITAEHAPDSEPYRRREALLAAGAGVCQVARSADGRLDLGAVLKLLGSEYSVLHLLVEGGSQLNRALLDNATAPALADKLCLFYAPMFLGEQGVPLIADDSPIQLEMRRFTVSENGSDFRVDAYLRDPWRTTRDTPHNGA